MKALILLAGVLFAASPVAQESNKQTVDHAELREQVSATLQRMRSLCQYDVGDSQVWVLGDSAVGRALNALSESSAPREQDDFAEATRLIETLAADPRQASETARLTPVMSFHVQSGPIRTAQWCTSDADYYSILRTPEQELLYWPQSERLEIGKHTRGLQMFRPTDLVAPLPASDQQIDNFVSASWRVEDLPEGRLRIWVLVADSDKPWMRLDVGPAPLRRPLGCTWYGTGSERRAITHNLYRWKSGSNNVLPAEVLAIRNSKLKVEIKRLRIQNLDAELHEQDIRLPVGAVKSVQDNTGEEPMQYRDLKALPEELQALILWTQPAAK